MTMCTCSGMMEHAQTVIFDEVTRSPKPFATAATCASLKMTGGYFSAFFAARRAARSCGTRASERDSVVFVARPKRKSSHEPTKSDHDPRGSFGSQNP